MGLLMPIIIAPSRGLTGLKASVVKAFNCRCTHTIKVTQERSWVSSRKPCFDSRHEMREGTSGYFTSGSDAYYSTSEEVTERRVLWGAFLDGQDVLRDFSSCSWSASCVSNKCIENWKDARGLVSISFDIVVQVILKHVKWSLYTWLTGDNFTSLYSDTPSFSSVISLLLFIAGR